MRTTEQTKELEKAEYEARLAAVNFAKAVFGRGTDTAAPTSQGELEVAAKIVLDS